MYEDEEAIWQTYALRAALATLWDLIDDAMNHACWCGKPDGEFVCPHCDAMEAARRFAEVAGSLKGSDRDKLGEWIYGPEGWMYHPPAPF